MEESSRKKHATIAQVADAAKVSKTTVSRYLNGRYEFMSEETKAEINRVIQQLDYHPSNIARSLKTRKSRVIGCIIADITSPFSSVLIKGINDVCIQNGYQVLFSNTDNQPERELNCIYRLLSDQVEGLIINSTGFNDDYLIDLHKKGVPIVLADRCLRTNRVIDTVTTENYGPVYSCMQRLYANGFEKVAFFTQGNGKISSRLVRYRGFLDASREIFSEDGEKNTFLVDTDDPSVCSRSLRTFVESNRGKRLAVFCVNGVCLLNVLLGMQKENYPISRELGICGYDDWGWASLIPPGITTITQDSYKVGKLSAETLLDRISGKVDSEAVLIELPNQLYVRGSTELGNL